MKHYIEFISVLLVFVILSIVGCGQNSEENLGKKLGYPVVPTVEKEYSDSDIIKVACVGDSITEGGYWRDNLQGCLDERFEVRGFGEGGSTVLFTGMDNGDIPKAYKDQWIYEASLRYEADIVVIMLGTNDSKEINWSKTEESEGRNFIDNYIELIESYKSLPSEPMVFVALPPTAFSDAFEISNSTIEEEIIPVIKVVASATGSIVIDTHSANAEHESEYVDGVHPDTKKGREVLAEAVAAAILEDVDGK